MQALLRKIRQILKDRRTRRFFTRAVSSVAAIVVFITTYALILPAITLERTAACGIEEHQHNDSCYEDRLVCGQEESDGHHHDDSCYSISSELICRIQEHQHSAENGCYDADGNLVCQLQEHVHDDSCYKEVRTLTCGLEESKGHQHTNACYKKVLICGKEVHTHSAACYQDTGENSDQESESGNAANPAVSENPGADSAASENNTSELTDSDNAATAETVLPGQEVTTPELAPLDFTTILNKDTGVYYYSVKPEEKIEDSSKITDWTRAKDKNDNADDFTELAPEDLIRVYLAYTVPAGSLNTTNPTARYRLPDSIRLSDKQIEAINKAENGISSQYDDKDKHDAALGAEAIEGTRRPDQDIDEYLRKNSEDGQEYINATVKAENVFNDKTGEYEGQDLIFTFTPYTIEKNQVVYDASGEMTKSGENVGGWFTFDMTTDQVEWGEAAVTSIKTGEESEGESEEAENIETENVEVDNTAEQTDEGTGAEAEENPDKEKTTDVQEPAEDTEQEKTSAEETTTSGNKGSSSVIERSERSADIVFVKEGYDVDNNRIEEIATTLKLVEEKEVENSLEDDSDSSNDDTASDFAAGTLEASGEGYKITMEYTAEAQVPENASLSVREITAETDPEAYKECLEQAGKKMASEDSDDANDKRAAIDETASRFFDIEIVVPEIDENGQETSRKIEPKAEVSVNIQMTDTVKKASDNSAQNTKENDKASGSENQGAQEPTVLHFTDDGVEKLQSTVVDDKNSTSGDQAEDREKKDSETAEDTDSAGSKNGSTEIQFTTDSFSIYGVVYTVDFHWEVNGKMYQFSISGGGFVSFENLIEVLGIIGDTYNEENEAEIAEQITDGMLNVTASEAAKKFVADVESVEFSNPELVWVEKVDTETTVGALKETNGLECEYSAELTEEQIEKINGTEVESGDWVLISMLPFASEESLTVTMKDGDVFTIKVTDAQIRKAFITASGESYVITLTYGEEAQIPDNAELCVREILAGTEEYASYLHGAAGKLSLEDEEISFARFFDIEIQDQSGSKIEPKAPVEVKIEYTEPLEIEGNSALNVVHFGDEKTEIISNVALSDEGGEITYTQDSFSVTGTIVSNPSQNNQYMVLVKDGDQYYIVNNDGSLTAVEYKNGAVSVDDPMLWTYNNNHIYHNSQAAGFTYRKVASDFYYRYLDPTSSNGINEDNESNTTRQHQTGTGMDYGQDMGYKVTNRSLWDGTALTYTGGKLKGSNNDQYIGITTDENGVKHVCGQQSAANAAEIVLAQASKVNSNIGPMYHTVDHIDVSIAGKSKVTVPLSYGTYYYKVGETLKSFDVTTSKKLELTSDVAITTDDMKRATITAYTLNADGSANMKDDVFYVTGYSSNKETTHSTDQVRIEGSFKVADMASVSQDRRHANDVNAQRLQNKIYYNVAATKPVTFKLIDPDYGQLYDENGEELTVTIDITMSGSFNYWDEGNECPGVHDMGTGPENAWKSGDIYDNGLLGGMWTYSTDGALSGMDFKLGGDADSNPNVVGLAITKLIVDENGKRIKPAQTEVIKNDFGIHWNENGNPNSVIGLDVGEFTTPADYTGYTEVHTKSIKVGRDGIGMAYDYDVKPGMLYISEDKSTINDTIKDVDDETWTYVGTRIETEYVNRSQPEFDGKMHVSDEYTKKSESMNSIPEVLGAYKDVNGADKRNGFVEYVVYNIYAPEKTDLDVEKNFEGGPAPADASVDIVLKRYKLVKDGSITPLEPTTGNLTINDTFTGLGAEQTYQASYHVTGPNGFDRTVTGNGGSIVLEDLEFGVYTVTKTASEYEDYDSANRTGTERATVGPAGAAVTFPATEYTRKSSAGTIFHVKVYAEDKTNGGYTWVDADYPAGTKLEFKAGIPSWNNNSTYYYIVNSETPFEIPKGQTKTYQFTLDKDYNIVIRGKTPFYSQWMDPEPTVTIVGSKKTMARRGLFGAESGLSEMVVNNAGTLPEVEGYNWQEDSTWYDGEGMTIHLPDGGKWSKHIEELDKKDPFGNTYVYYIDSVKEHGMPSGTFGTITLDGENKLFVYGDHKDEGAEHTNGTLSVVNQMPTEMSIQILKLKKGTTETITGASFSIQKFKDASHQQKDGEPITGNVDANGSLTLSGLEEGYYQLKETVPPTGYVKTSDDPYFEVKRNEATGELEVIFMNTSMITYESGTFKVENEPGAALPNTGGPGTRIFTILGSILILGAGVLLLRRRRLI